MYTARSERNSYNQVARLIVRFINKLLGKDESTQQKPREKEQPKGKSEQKKPRNTPSKTSHSLTQDADQSKARHNLHQERKNENQEHKQECKKDKPRNQKSPQKKKSADLVTDWDISSFNVPAIDGKTRFHDFDLAPQLMHGIADLGFQYCSPIQAQSLPYALQGRDLVGKAQTGTGKTAAFLTAIIDYLLKTPLTEKPYAGEARALIIAPTRELVMQIAEDAKSLCKYTDLNIHTLVGGMDYTKQQRHLHNALVDILVATPGRLLDFVATKMCILINWKSW